MKVSMRLVLVLMSVGLASAATAADSVKTPTKTPTTTQMLMRQKLECAHGLLEGIVRENFDMITKNAETLATISRATTWHKQDSAEFLHFAKSFQNSADFLVEQAKAKNIEGVALGQMRVTLDCMQCHTFVRGKSDK